MSIKSWIRDKLEDFGDWLYEKVIQPAVNWLRDAIENIVTALRIFRHNMKAKLAEWLENDWFFLAFVTLIVAGVYYIPKIMVKMQSWIVKIWIESMAIKIKEAVVNVIDVNLYIDIVTLHKVMMVVWGEYRETAYAFADAVSQLAAELGEGSGYLHAYFAALRGIMHGTNAILGGDPLQTEIECYGRTAAFFEKANDRFARYARDPGRLIYDFLNEVLIPAATENRDISQAQMDEIRNNRNRLVEIDEGQKELQTSLDTFIELQPNVIEEQIRERWDPINEAWIEIQTVFFGEMMRVVNGVVDAVEWHYQRQLEINRVVEEKQNSAQARIDFFMNLAEFDQEMIGSTFDFLLYQGNKEEMEDLNSVVSQYVRDYNSITFSYIRNMPISPALLFESSYVDLIPDIAFSIPSPFVGDY